MELWADRLATMAARRRSRSGAALRQTWRAATRPLRLPAEPPETKTPPVPDGSPARSASQRRASFSAKTAPAPSSHDPP